MIVFQTTNWQLDLSNEAISLQEKNPYFSDEQSKSYSYPFNLKITDASPTELQSLVVNNVVNYKSKIYGTLILDRTFYDAYIAVNSVKGDTIEIALFYGKETLKVFDKTLSALPFPVIFAANGLSTFAKAQLTKSWPEATHNFPMVFREAIKEEANFEQFELFVNHYYNNGGTYEFKTNSYETVESAEVPYNRNVMAPMPYLMEVLKVAFKTEGLNISGDFVNDAFNQKILMVPKKYMEQYAQTQFLNYSFTTFNSQETINGKTVNVYTQTHTPTATGSYSIDMRINMNDVVAQYFSLTVTQNGIELYSAFSEKKEVIIEKTLDINIVDTLVFDDIIVALKTIYTNESIENQNSFTYQYKEGSLSVFPDLYNLADYMPDINFREFTNRIKTLFNLKFDYTDTTVYINYLEKELERISFIPHSHFQQPEPPRTLSENNLFRLKYKEGDEVMVNQNGQTYTDADYTDDETEKIEIEAHALKVKDRQGIVTGIYPEDEQDIMLMLYDGLVENLPLAKDNINNESLDLQHIYNKYWVNWLRFRSNSETYKDSFFMSVHEEINIKEGSFKYNKNHIIKSIDRKRINEHWWQVDVESETF